MTKSSHPITHVIYDMDGLLLDTEVLYTQVTQQIVGRFGKTFDWSVKAQMLGRPALDSARHLVDALGLPISAEQYLREREHLLEQLFPGCAALPGAERLVRHFKRRGIAQALATSSSQKLLGLKMRAHKDWFALLDCMVTGDDPEVLNGKPAPDIFLTAAKRLRAQPQNCLVFEDAPSGLRAGLAAAMTVVVVPDPNMSKDLYADAHQILYSLEQFDPSLWGLPAFTDR